MSAAGAERRGRLFRKYVIFFVALVSGALIASGSLEIYFSYQENKAALAQLQLEKALSAANRIEQWIKEVERQIGWTTHPQVVTGKAALEQRRVDYFRLLRQVQPVTEVSQLDGAGKEQLRVSRLAMDLAGSQADFSKDPKFYEAVGGQTYFSPVYFRKESEPYMTVSMASTSGTRSVTVAEVNLKFIWDVISQIKIGRAGHAFVVDSHGQLIAHPDISLVLKKSDFSSLGQVQSASGGPDPSRVLGKAMIGADVQGRQVLTAFAPIAPLGWLVFVEQPLTEAFEGIRASILRAALLILVGIGLSVLAGLLLARRMVKPIQALQAGAARIGAGELGHRIDVKTGDELETLADQFNRTAAQLQESYANLEQKVEARTRELSEALEQQTATSEVLRVISSSPNDLGPVFEAMLANATRLCDASTGALFLYSGGTFDLVAHRGANEEWIRYAKPGIQPRPGSGLARMLAERRPVHIADIMADPAYPAPPRPDQTAGVGLLGARACLWVPMLKESALIGAMVMYRREARPFSDKQIELVRTFADQAVIAISNVRLFQELEARTGELARSVEQLQALGEVSRAISSSLDLETVLTRIAAHAVQLSATDGGAIYEYDEGSQQFHLRVTHHMEGQQIDELRAQPIRLGEGALGQAAVRREPVQVADVVADPAYSERLRDGMLRTGFHALLAVPLLREGGIVGGLVVRRRAPGEFPAEMVDLLRTFANQSALAIQNAKLFREIADKSAQLEVANRHKSEFLANMSHELRTPLNAVIGFSEVLLERMFGELNAKQAEYLEDILSSGRHLLSLINDILDLSKIEAGRMELELSVFDLPVALDNALILVRERATRHGIGLDLSIDPEIGTFVGDERKIKQVLVNLLSNAVKFTPEGGKVAVRAARADGAVEISVTDTGIGIAPEDQGAIFEEFRQVGGDYARKREGTGLGLALARRFVELHGGRLQVTSELGRGSTFTFSIPERPWPVS